MINGNGNYYIHNSANSLVGMPDWYGIQQYTSQ